MEIWSNREREDVMKAECYSEDFICSSSPLIPIHQRKHVVRNRTTGRFAVIDNNKNVLVDVKIKVTDCRLLLYED
jgi:hypothetical protein